MRFCDADVQPTTDLVFGATSLHLVGKNLCSRLLGLGLVDVFHQDTLVLENVSFRLHVERVVTAMRSR